MDKEFISFLKQYNIYNKEIVDSFYNNSLRYDSEIDGEIGLNMCIYAINDDDVLVDLKACVPCIKNYKTMLVNVHEYIHYYIMYKKLGKKVIIGRNCELLPLVYEKLFIMEKNDDALNRYAEKLDRIIKKDNNPDYIYALEYRDKLIDLLYKKKFLKK